MFKKDGCVKTAVARWLITQATGFYQQDIQKWSHSIINISIVTVTIES